MPFDVVTQSLAGLPPEDLWPTWCRIDALEQAGQIKAEDALRWKHGIFGLMELCEIDPNDLVPPVLM